MSVLALLMATLLDLLSAALEMLARLFTVTSVLTRYAVPVSVLCTTAKPEDVIVAGIKLTVGAVVSGVVVATVKAGISRMLLTLPS